MAGSPEASRGFQGARGVGFEGGLVPVGRHLQSQPCLFRSIPWDFITTEQGPEGRGGTTWIEVIGEDGHCVALQMGF